MSTFRSKFLVLCCVLILFTGLFLSLSLSQKSQAADYAWTNTGGGISTASVSSLLRDGSTIYAGTGNSTVWQYNTGTGTWSQLGGSIGTGNTVKSLAICSGVLYAGTSGQGVWRYSSGSWSNVSGSTINTYSINALAVDGTTIYAGTTSHGVYRSTNGTSWDPYKSIFQTFDYTINTLSLNGSTLYAGTSANGVYRYSIILGWQVLGTGISSYGVNALIWVGGSLYAGIASHGVWRLGGSTWTNISSSVSLSGYTVNALAADTTNLYAGTASHGVWRYTPSSSNWLDIAGGIATYTVQALALDGASIPYAGTAGQGVWKYDVTTPTSPSIASINPASGPVGTAVSIAGSGFGSSGTLTIGGTTVATTSWTDSQIQFAVPSMSTGVKQVVVTAAGGSANTSFTVTDVIPTPAISSISPNQGPVGTAVSIAGSGFGSSGTLTIGGTTVATTSWTDSQIQFAVPSMSTGVKQVVVTAAGGSANTSFTVTDVVPTKPAISSITPNNGPTGTWVTIAGSGFGSSGSVTIGGTAAATTSWTDNQIQFWVPAGLSTGSQTVTVTAPGGAANTSFTVTEAGEDPMIVSMYPTEGPPGTIVNLVGTGFGLIQIPLLSTVKVSGVTADVDVWSDVLIRFTVPSLAPGDKEVKVSTVLGSTTATFTVTEALPAPVITSLSPDNGPAGSWVAINGSNFGATWQEGCCVLFNSTEIILTTWNENQVMFTVPADASGTASVRVETLSGISNALPFTVTEIPPGPAITSITPDSAAVGTEITLAGSRFGNERGDSKVSIIWWFLPTDLAAGDYVSWSDTEIKFKVPQMSPGEYSVAVTAGGQQSNAMAFDIVEVPLPPGIDYISPGSGTPGTAVTIGGSGFGSSQGTSTLKFGSTDVTPTSWSNNQITCNVPSMAAGTVQVSVTTSLGTDSMDFTVTEPVVLPTITSITPAQGSAGTAVTIDGTNFGNERGDSKVTFVWFLWMGTDIADYTSWSSSQIKFNLPDGMGAGSYSVMVTAGGQQSNSVPFEVIVEVPPVPHIASMSPTTGNPGADVTITGTDFGATQGTSKVSFGSVDVVTYTSWSNTEIKCKAPWQPAGVVQVGVTTAGGISNTAPFTMTTPPPGQLEVTSITPNQGTTLDFSLSVNVQGEGFLEGATIKLDNGTATIEASNIVRVSSTEMTATFGLFMSQPGQYNVTVTNPDSGQATLENAFTVADACGTGSGTALLGFGLMMGLLSISGSGFFRRRLRKNKNK